MCMQFPKTSIMCIYMLLAFASLAAALALPNPSLISADPDIEKEFSEMEVGISPSYVKAAHYFINAINQSCDPCEDFFGYACGRWISDHPIPTDLASYGIFASIREKVAREMKELYESNVPTGSRAMDSVRMIFQACMNTESQKKLRGREIVKAIEYLGYWPIVHGPKWNEEQFDLTTLLIRVAQTRTSDSLLDIYVAADQKNVTRRLIHIDQGALGLGSGAREYYLNETRYGAQLSAYKNYITAKAMLIANDAGIPLKENDIEGQVDEIIAFEKELAEISVPQDQRRNFTKLYNLRHLSELKMYISSIDWQRYFYTLLPEEIHWYLDADPVISLSEIEYLEDVDELLKEKHKLCAKSKISKYQDNINILEVQPFTKSPKRLVANYIIWRYTSSWSFQIDSRYDDIQQDFFREVIGKQAKSPRWKDCSQAVVGRMPYASGALYVRHFFNKADKDEALAMVNELRHAFKDILKESEWMGERTRKKALKKTEEMINLIGYPDFVRSTKELDDYYKLLHIEPGDTYAEIVTKTSRWSLEHSFRKLVKPYDRKEFGASASTVNAFYSSLKNAVVFPAGILQAPLFDRRFPKAMNFGGVGSIIGHEITHGFDDQGSQFDEKGNLRQWWDEETASNFHKKRKCFVKQYSQYKVHGTDLYINGKLTQGENIADNGGVKESFRAYRNYIAKLGHEEKRLPGLENLSMNQVFFLSYALTWCGHSRPAALVRQALTDAHAPLRIRVNGVVMNHSEFAKVFSCDRNSPMNPPNKCALW